MTNTSTDPIIRMTGISKGFPGVQALDGVDFHVRPGEIHALMGENGAGKSTLIKVLTGVNVRDAGDILFGGRSISLKAPHEAPAIGLSTVYQEVNLAPNLSVAENIYLGRQPGSFARINWKKLRALAETALARLDLKLDVSRLLSSYPIAVQQMVAIARAVDIQAKVLILDEPTSSLDAKEVRRLFAIMRKLRDDGLAIVFVTHFLDQVYEMADRITVLRNGGLVGEFLTAELPRLELIAKMMGKEISELSSIEARTGATAGDSARTPLVETIGFGKRGLVHPFNLDLRSGEVLGLAGLLGSGRTEIAQLLFGLHRADSGSYRIDGKAQKIGTPRKAIAHGLGYCPEDRKAEAIVGDLTIRENIILALQARRGILRFLSRRKQEELADHYITLLNIVTPSSSQKIKNLSGGNQQKVVIARWLAANPRLLILDEPTRGIDVGAKAEIQKNILKLSREGMSILFISAELSEIVRCAGRVAVMRDRRMIAELSGKHIEEHTIMHTIAEGGRDKP